MEIATMILGAGLFFSGLLLGRKSVAPLERAEEKTQEMSRLEKQWRNILTYDGREQSDED